MKLLFTALLMFFLSVCHAEGTQSKNVNNKVCVNIPGRGINTEKVKKTCKKGDLIQVNEINTPFLCDFNYAIARYSIKNNHVCVYLGKRRELREGTNF